MNAAVLQSDATDRVAAFVVGPLRMLAERGVALVVAVHEDYLQMEGYRQQATGFLDTTVSVPSLPRPLGMAVGEGAGRVTREAVDAAVVEVL